MAWYSALCAGRGKANDARANGIRRPASQQMSPRTMTRNSSSAKIRDAGSGTRLATRSPASVPSILNSARRSSKMTAKPRRACRTARSRVRAWIRLWHTSAKLPRFIRRESRPRNSSSSSCATASQSAAKRSAGTRASGASSRSSDNPAALSTRPSRRASPRRPATAERTKTFEIVPFSIAVARAYSRLAKDVATLDATGHHAGALFSVCFRSMTEPRRAAAGDATGDRGWP